MNIVLFDLGSTLIYFKGPRPEAVARSRQALADSLERAGFHLDRDAFLEAFNTRDAEYSRKRENENLEFTSLFILKEQIKSLGYTNGDDSVLQRALDDMYAVTQEIWQPEDDALPVIKELTERGYRLGIISNAADDNDVQTLVDKLGARQYFDIVISSAAAGIRKPNPEIFHMALNHWQASPSQAVMVGDRLDADILGAHNCMMPGIWITRRIDPGDDQSSIEKIQPDQTIATLAELPGVLSKYGEINKK